MFIKKACVKSQYGIHARPSAVIATVASRDFPDTEIIIMDTDHDQQGRALSVLEIMMMALPCGTIVTVSASGKDEEKAVEAVVQVIESFEVEVK